MALRESRAQIDRAIAMCQQVALLFDMAQFQRLLSRQTSFATPKLRNKRQNFIIVHTRTAGPLGDRARERKQESGGRAACLVRAVSLVTQTEIVRPGLLLQLDTRLANSDQPVSLDWLKKAIGTDSGCATAKRNK